MGDGRYPIKRRGVDGEVVNVRPLVRRQDPRDEGPSADDLEKFGGVTRTCTSCGKEVYDDATTCYHCGANMEAPRHAQLPKVWVVVVVLLLVATLVFIFTR
jgi:predicted nucleic acid-binding Zn ribbon protein